MIGFLQWLFSLQAAYLWCGGIVVFLLWYVFANEMTKTQAIPKKPPVSSVEEIPTADQYGAMDTKQDQMEDPQTEAWKHYLEKEIPQGPRASTVSKLERELNRTGIDFESVLAESLLRASWRPTPGSTVAIVKDKVTNKFKAKVESLKFEVVGDQVPAIPDGHPEETVSPSMSEPPAPEEES